MEYPTLQADAFDNYKIKHKQFKAISIKNYVLLSQSWCGILFIFIFSMLFSIGIGYLHTYYVSIHDDDDPGTQALAPVPMPVEGFPKSINHNIFMTFADHIQDGNDLIGDLYENSTKQPIRSKYLSVYDKGWQGQKAHNVRSQWVEYNDLHNFSDWNMVGKQSTIPFITRGDKFDKNITTYEQLDSYVNDTTYRLMEQDMNASKIDGPNKTKFSLVQQIANGIIKTIMPNAGKRNYHNGKPIIITADSFNQTQQFIYDKHEYLFTSAVNFSDLKWQNETIGWNYTISSYSSHQTSMDYSLTNHQHLGGTQYFLFHGFLRNVFKTQNSDPPLVQGHYKQFWEPSTASGADPFTPIFVCLVLPLCFYLLVPQFSYQISQEKGDGLIALQSMMGLKYMNRFLGDLCYQLVISVVMYAIIVGVLAGFGMEFITVSSPVAWVFTTILFMFNIPVLSFLIASFTEQGRISSIIGIFLILVYAIVGIVWCQKFYQEDGLDHTVSYWWSLIPGLAPLVALVNINGLVVSQDQTLFLKDRYVNIYKVLDGTQQATVGYSVAMTFLIGYIMLFVYLFLSIYIDRITPIQNGIPDHPMFFCQSLYERSCVRAKRPFKELNFYSALWAIGQFFIHPSLIMISQTEIEQYVSVQQESKVDADNNELSQSQSNTHTFDYGAQTSEKTQGTSTVLGEVSSSAAQLALKQKQYRKAVSMNQQKEDLEVERKNTISNARAFNGMEPLVRLLNLKKTYPATKNSPANHAVKGIYYTIGKNECMCLLGGNGCGKTTQINMLCMLFKPTSGTAYVCGHSITDRSARESIQQNLGVCPQFDVLYPTMTVLQHLKFYCRIKGVPEELLSEHCNDLIQAVGLKDSANTASSKLSGGMKRRLSIAIALSCKPKVLVFDEPSSGLDPDTRRQIWNVIIKARQGRAILLTTHAMEEAECLATRITIMAEGSLRCIGTVDDLQKRFGTGYQLQVSVDRDLDQEKDDLFVGKVYLATKAEQNAHKRVVKDVHPNLVLLSCYQGNLTYSVPEKVQITDLFQAMETVASDHSNNISDWGLNQTSLDTVFNNVVTQSGF